MADPITTVLTTAAEHAPSAAAATIALKAAKDFLAKVAGPAVEELGEIGRDYVKGWRAKNGSAVLARADTLLAEAGREPQAVPLKTLLPLLDAASLEDEPTLAEKWAALLANAADPLGERIVTPVYADILRQLTSQEVKVLDMLFVAAVPQTDKPSLPNREDDHRLFVKRWTTSHMLNPGLLYTIKKREGGRISYTMQDRIEQDRLDTIVDNFLRQQILILAKSKPPKERSSSSDLEPEKSNVFFTSLGYDFMLAVTPPTP